MKLLPKLGNEVMLVVAEATAIDARESPRCPLRSWVLPCQPSLPSLAKAEGLAENCAFLYPFSRRRQWHPTPVLLPGKSHGRRSLVGCSPWGLWSQTRLSDFTFTFHFHALEKEMATHSSVLAWRIPGTGSLVGCRLWGRTESDTTEAT